jgi:hypothetical protein
VNTTWTKKVALWNKGHFEEKRRVCSMFKILSSYICWNKIHKMQHLEGSGTPVLYIDARFLKIKVIRTIVQNPSKSIRKLHFVFVYSSSGKSQMGKHSKLTQSLPKSVRIGVHAACRPPLLSVLIRAQLAQFQRCCCLVVTPRRLDVAINLARDL